MDLKDLKPKTDKTTVILLHPVTLDPLVKDDGTEMSITVYLPHSKVYKEVLHEQANRRIDKAAKAGGKLKFTVQEVEASAIEMLARITVDWDIVLDGQTPELTVETASELYKDYPWIKAQLDEAVEDVNSFMKA